MFACSYCERKFDSIQQLAGHCSSIHGKAKIALLQRAEEIKNLYLNEGMSANDIGDILGVSNYLALRIIHQLNIPIRNYSQARLAAFKRYPPKRGSEHHRWKGGRRIGESGYISVYRPEHPNANKRGYVPEHRLVIEQKIGRFLTEKEQVHHINGIKGDNRPGNLELLSQANNMLRDKFCRDCPLRTEIRLLRWQVKELSESLQEKLNLV